MICFFCSFYSIFFVCLFRCGCCNICKVLDRKKKACYFFFLSVSLLLHVVEGSEGSVQLLLDAVVLLSQVLDLVLVGVLLVLQLLDLALKVLRLDIHLTKPRVVVDIWRRKLGNESIQLTKGEDPRSDWSRTKRGNDGGR